jgi:hypothetical protein
VEEKEDNWNNYFLKIKPVCPWGAQAWKRGEILIQDWNGTPFPLGSWKAHVYLLPKATRLELWLRMKYFNLTRKREEWLYSHPKNKGNSTPSPCLIQQDRYQLEQIRDGKI